MAYIRRTPKNIRASALYSHIADQTLPYYLSLIKQGWSFYVVDSNRGECCYAAKTITIPLWLETHKVSEVRWYIAHEIAHAFSGHLAAHGPVFMATLKKICPAEDQFWEYTYKPKNALSAGLELDFSEL